MAGGHKLLRPYPDEPVIRRSVRVALAASETVGVVTGETTEVAEALSDLSVELLENARAAEGAATSVRVAAEWAFERARALILVLGDEPDLDPDTIDLVRDRWVETGSSAVRVRYTDRPGHPVLITPQFFSEFALSGDVGFRDALADLSHEIRAAQPAPADLDTEADYQAALARLTQ